MNAITTHVLDTVLGKPAAGIRVRLDQYVNGAWILAGQSVTDTDGRCRDLMGNAERGTFRLTFATGEYLAGQRRSTIYPEVIVAFEFSGDTHFHLPLLLSDNSYTTYRGN